MRPDQSTQPEAVTIPTRTPSEQQELAEELATIERDRKIDLLRAIEATLLECAQTPQDRFLAESAVLRLETQRKLYKKAISDILEYNITKTTGRKPNLYDALRYFSRESHTGTRPVASKMDRFRTQEQEFDTAFLIFSQQSVYEPSSTSSPLSGDSYPPSDQYLTKVVSKLTNSQVILPLAQNLPRFYLTTMKGVSINTILSKHLFENETSILLTPPALEQVINYTPSPAPAAPQGTV